MQTVKSSSAAPAPKPWYREPWTWGLMAGPAIAVVAGFVTLGLALRSDDGLVADDYYKQGLAINRTLARERRADELRLEANASFSGRHIRVVLRGAGAPPPELRLRLVHPTRSGHDAAASLRPIGPGVYEGEFGEGEFGKGDFGQPVSAAGGVRREIILEDAGGTWRLWGEFDMREASVTLGAVTGRH